MFTEYSLWFLPLIILISLGISWLFYFFRKDKAYSPRQRYILSTLRFLSLFLILFLFLSPVKRVKHKTIEKPTIVVVQDNSSSITYGKPSDSAFYRGEYLKKLASLSHSLKRDYNVVNLSFGSTQQEIEKDKDFTNSIDYKDFATDFSTLYSYIAENYSSENLSAIVLASDGINTQGGNILNINSEISCPVYTIAMGDNRVKKDIRISDVQYNKVAFLDNEYPLEITIVADKLKGKTSSLFIEKGGARTLVKNINISEDDFSVTIPYTSIAKKVGTEKVSFILSTVDNEENIINNRKDIYVEVLDSKKKILILASAPHPDIAAFKSVIEQNKNYESQFATMDDMSKVKDISAYDMIILHNLPNNTNSTNIVKSFMDKDIPLLFVIGQNTNIALFNSLKTSLYITPLSSGTNQSIASYNSSFSLFTMSENCENIIKNFPPLLSPIAKYSMAENSNILLYQKIGSVSTSYPLIAFSENGNTKTGFILGENIWRWRVNNYLINQTHEESDELIMKTLKLVADKSARSHFHIEYKEIYSQNEDIILQAQLYNENFELVNTPEVEILLTHKNKTSKYTFGKTHNAYVLNLGKMEEGEYSFLAKTSMSNKNYTEKGAFVVSSIALEQSDLRARHNELYTLSASTGGSMVYPKDVEKLEKLITNNQDIKPIIHLNIENRRFISLWWYWLLIILSLGGEWFLRKYWGRI